MTALSAATAGFTGFAVGANAEYKCRSERASLTTMPPTLSFPRAEIVEAHRYVDGGHQTGNVVITVVDD